MTDPLRAALEALDSRDLYLVSNTLHQTRINQHLATIRAALVAQQQDTDRPADPCPYVFTGADGMIHCTLQLARPSDAAASAPKCEGWHHMTDEDRADCDPATYCDAYEGHESAEACPPGCCATRPFADAAALCREAASAERERVRAYCEMYKDRADTDRIHLWAGGDLYMGDLRALLRESPREGQPIDPNKVLQAVVSEWLDSVSAEAVCKDFRGRMNDRARKP